MSSLSGVRVGPLVSNGLVVKIRLTHELDALFDGNLGLPARRLVEVRVVGHGVVNVAVEGTLDVLGVDVGAEREKPVWGLVVDRDWAALKRAVAYAAVAGVALGLYSRIGRLG